jgi:hypothetical protein
MERSDLPAAIIVTKRNAALRQIVVAIDLLQKGLYDCAITLAGAAEGMIPNNEHGVHLQLLSAQIPEELQSTFYAAFDRTERNTFWNTARDWLKHLTPTLPPDLQIGRHDAEFMIVRALTKLNPVPEEIPESDLPPLVWFYQSFLNLSEEEFVAELAEAAGTEP